MNRHLSVSVFLGLAAFAALAQTPTPTTNRPAVTPRPVSARTIGGTNAPAGPDFRGGAMSRANPLMQALDLDHNGELSEAELANATTALKALDKNGDGKVGADELRVNVLGGPRGTVPSPIGNTNAVASLMAYDKNGDGKLTADELPERMQRTFTRADADKDGVVTKAELDQLMAAMPARPGILDRSALTNRPNRFERLRAREATQEPRPAAQPSQPAPQ